MICLLTEDCTIEVVSRLEDMSLVLEAGVRVHIGATLQLQLDRFRSLRYEP